MSDGASGEAVIQGTTGEPKTPEEIRTEIEQTREQLGETVEARQVASAARPEWRSSSAPS